MIQFVEVLIGDAEAGVDERDIQPQAEADLHREGECGAKVGLGACRGCKGCSVKFLFFPQNVGIFLNSASVARRSTCHLAARHEIRCTKRKTRV